MFLCISFCFNFILQGKNLELDHIMYWHWLRNSATAKKSNERRSQLRRRKKGNFDKRVVFVMDVEIYVII